MAEPIELTGITWDHSRALPPLVAASQRYEELNPGRRIRWKKRSLHEFGHMPIDQLADRFDLVVIDHPWAGFCFRRHLVRDLRPLLGEERFGQLAANFIGPSWESYLFDGKLLALPIDAAAPAPSWRPDLMKARGAEVPRRWNEAVALADQGLAAMPGFPADLFLNWLMLLEALEGRPFAGPDEIGAPGPAREAMDLLKRLAEKMPAAIYDWNPIRLAEEMTRGDSLAYCPFAYSYNNYARSSFAAKPVRYGNVVHLEDGRELRSITGGTGLAVTRRCKEMAAAIDFSLFCASAGVQRGIYALSGGQPAHQTAWTDPGLDDLTGGFFGGALQTHQRALVRPRYDGYVPLQEQAGRPLQEYLRGERSQAAAWETINKHYRKSLPEAVAPES